MKNSTLLLLAVSFITAFFACPLNAREQAESNDAWQVYLIPYFWAPSLDADSTVNGLTGSVDLSFNDVLDYFDFGAMGRVEAWKEKWGLTFDGVFMNLSIDESFDGSRGAVRFDLDADVRLGMADFGLAYRLYEEQLDNEQKLTFEPYGGLRYGYLRQKIDLNVTIPNVGLVGAKLGDSEDWVEPFIGGRIRWYLNDKWAIDFRGDAGGFGIGSASDLLWQIALGVDYKMSDKTSLIAGYRYLELDYSRGSGSSEFGIDMKAQGPYLGMSILF